VAGEYASGEYRYWHLSVPSPELTVAIEDGWFPTRGRVLDLGCGAGTEVGFLAGLGATSVGIDLSVDALTIAFAEHGSGRFVQADVTQLPLPQDPSTQPSTAAASARGSSALRHRGRPCPSSGRPVPAPRVPTSGRHPQRTR
jgi:SAM-dependent methyltransferase